MRTGSPLAVYGKRYIKTFFRKLGEFLWQQIIVGAVLAVCILLQQIHRNIISTTAIRANILAVLEPYLFVIGVLVLWHLGRTAYLLHLEDRAEIDRLVANQPPVEEIEPPAPVEPLSVDLRGVILELYFHKENDLLSFPSHTIILIKAQIVNHGPVEATITQVGLQVRIGAYQSMCDLVKNIPDTWQIRRRDDKYLNMVYINTPLDSYLGSAPSEETYRTAIPRSGWLAFELYGQENIEFPNAEFNLLLMDSLGGKHRIQRKPQMYIKTGDIVAIPSPIPSIPNVV
jgi:hypothetical protein